MSTEYRKETFTAQDVDLLASPVTLPNGQVMPNRFAKVSMYENLSSIWGGVPNRLHKHLYARWAKGGWGMLLTGNVQVSPSHLSLGRDLKIPEGQWKESQLKSFRELAAAMHNTDKSTPPLAIMQISHAGRQSPRLLGGRLLSAPDSCSSHRLATSPRGLVSDIITKLMYQEPNTLSTAGVEKVVQLFSRAAQLASRTGFDGVQVHAAHGYLLSSFLSKKINDRSDVYRDRLVVLKQIIDAIKAATPSQFVVGIKLNAATYACEGLSEEQALEDCKQIALMGFDFIEISGGNYEEPEFASSRQVFFASYSRQAVAAISTLNLKKPPLVLLTGGLRTPSQCTRVLSQNIAHALGFGRLSVLCPDLPNRILSSDSKDGVHQFKPIPEPVLAQPESIPKFASAGIGTAWYDSQIKLLAQGKEVDMDIGSVGAMINLSTGGPHEFSSWFKLCLIIFMIPYLTAKVYNYQSLIIS